jgi:hypothetical protein
MFSVSYAVLDRALAEAGSAAEAAESHGCLCGALVAMTAYRPADWIQEVWAAEDEGPVPVALRETLETAFMETAQALGGQSMEFEPLLPDDDQPLADRVTALGQWCQGFLYGVGVGQLPPLDTIAGEVGEVLKDFSEISRAAIDSDDSEESNEDAYIELLEFVRIGTQTLYEELGPTRERHLVTGGSLH